MKYGHRPTEVTEFPTDWVLERKCGKQSRHGSYHSAKSRATKHRNNQEAGSQQLYSITGPNGERFVGFIGDKLSRNGHRRIEWVGQTNAVKA